MTSVGQGNFCGGTCNLDSDCPTNYACQDAKGTQGAGKQCVRTSGECGCSPKAILDGASTTCSVQNEAGTCGGVRKCTPAGLTPCSAATPAAEVCDGVDNDCNGETDGPGTSGCTTYFTDADGDQYGTGAGTCTCAPPAGGGVSQGGDCEDSDKGVHPGAVELCNNLDDNCDGKTDEGCDDDGDGWCDIALQVVGEPLVCPQGKKDCNDADPTVHPGQQDACGNNVDDDCDGTTDVGTNISGCIVFFADADGDGYGTGTGQCLCAASSAYAVKVAGDCDDAAPSVHPGAAELCNTVDDNCNQVVDEAGASGCSPYFMDTDGDAFGAGASQCLCGPDGTYTVKQAGDCDDAVHDVHPGATEVCDGLDNDCDGKTDINADDCTNYYADKDNDGYGTTALASKCLCGAIPGYVAQAGDCNDASADIRPGAVEACNGVDDNCDGLKDPVDSANCTVWYLDVDADGYGQTAVFQCQCTAGQGFTAIQGGDCDDGSKLINPEGAEICNGKDDNCNGQTDEVGDKTFYADVDKDGYGWAASTVIACVQPFGYVSNSADCNDAESASHPGGVEVCDGIDNNCNAQTDEGVLPTWYADLDQDTFGDINTTQLSCTQPAGFVLNASDCNDTDPVVYPGNAEVCDGKDNGCNGQTDEGVTTTYFKDADGDGYGDKASTRQGCTAPATYVSNSTDCNDTLAGIHPGATELCNGFDDNCDGNIDEGVKSTYYKDADGDGYGNSAGGTVQACTQPIGYAANTTDCDDTHANVYPGFGETCDGLDNNCNGSVDEGVKTTYYLDNDNDTYGQSGNTTTACSKPAGYASVGGDCNDANSAIRPNATEVCSNSLDDNCNGAIDENCSVQACTWSTLLDFSIDKGNTAGVSLSGNLKPPYSNGFLCDGGKWCLEYSKDPTSGYASGSGTGTVSLTIPSGAQKLRLVIPAFNNLTYCSDDSCTSGVTVDNTIYATFTVAGWTSANYGPTSANQYQAAKKYIEITPNAAWTGGSATATFGVAGAKTSSAYWGGIGFRMIEVCK